MWPLLGQTVLTGIALGVLGFTAGSLFLYDADGLLGASVGFVVTLVVALGVGIWAGIPTGGADEFSLRARWFAAGAVVAVAGGFATVWNVYDAVRIAEVGRVLALLLLIAAPCYVLGFLLPCLLVRAERSDELTVESEDERAEDIGGWRPLGVVVLGVLGGVALGAVFAGLLLLPRISAGPLLFATAAGLILPTLFPESSVGGVHARSLFDIESPLSHVEVVEVLHPGGQPERRLYLNGEEESAELARSGNPTLPYIAAAEQWLAEVSSPGDRYVFLGGGAYTLPRLVAERDASARISVIELDPEVTRVAYRFFGLRPEHRIRSLHGDARALLEHTVVAGRGDALEADRIYLDVYHGSETLPYPLVTREAFELLRRLLRPGGTLALNAIGVVDGPGARRFWSIVRTLADVFPSVVLYTHLGSDFPQRQNVLLGATGEANVGFPERAGRFGSWPRQTWPPVEGTIIFRDLFSQPPAGADFATRERRGDRAASAP